MIVATRYTIDKAYDVWRIRNFDAPLYPVCGSLCSGYDTRKRHNIDSAGCSRCYALRRLLCPVCGKLPTEIPVFMRPRKRYAAEIIEAVIEGRGADCPADDRTIRRWRRENYPPEMSGFSRENALQSTHTDKKEGGEI
jgi:hypothetical protein